MLEFLAINPGAIDPTIIFTGLILSLWLGVTAAHMPGTGILEGVALVGLLGVLIVLVQMEVRWFALLLLVLGAGVFMVVPFIHQKYAPWALGGLAVQGIGSILLFEGQMIHPLALALSLVIPFAYYQFLLHPALEQLREQPAGSRDEYLVGSVGRVTRDIDPVGTIHVNSETWTATSDQRILEGTQAIVVGREGLRLIVEGIKEKRREEFAPEDLTE